MPDLSQKPDKPINKWALVNLAMEFGYIIALPLVVFALAGKWLDHRVGDKTQWFTLLGIILAITFTTIWMTKRLKEYIK